MEEVEFKKRIKKVSDNRNHKIKNSWGVYDAFKWYRKNKPKDKKFVLTESQYFSIIRTLNNKLKELFISKGDLTIPCGLGRLELKKRITKIVIENGKIKTNLPINWDATLKLWCEDKESLNQKKLIRINTPEVFRTYYNKYRATYKYKEFYQFSINRELKKLIKQEIINNSNFDAFL